MKIHTHNSTVKEVSENWMTIITKNMKSRIIHKGDETSAINQLVKIMTETCK